MIIDEYGLPKDTGATDKMDSARLAGIMSMIGHPSAPDLSKYIIGDQAVRHPHEEPANNPNNFTRDQLMCLVAGLHAQGRTDICKSLYLAAKKRGYKAQNSEYDYPGTTKKFPNGRDILSPSNMLALRIAAGEKGFALGHIWVVIDILFNAIFTPTREPNQLICQLYVISKKYLKLYKFLTPKWKLAITEYWGGWRGEPELADQMINWLGGL